MKHEACTGCILKVPVNKKYDTRRIWETGIEEPYSYTNSIIRYRYSDSRCNTMNIDKKIEDTVGNMEPLVRYDEGVRAVKQLLHEYGEYLIGEDRSWENSNDKYEVAWRAKTHLCQQQRKLNDEILWK